MIRPGALLTAVLILSAPAARVAADNIVPLINPAASPSPKAQDPVALREMQIHFLLATEHYKERDYQAAIDEWIQVLKINPNHQLAREKIQKAREKLSAAGGQ